VRRDCGGLLGFAVAPAENDEHHGEDADNDGNKEYQLGRQLHRERASDYSVSFETGSETSIGMAVGSASTQVRQRVSAEGPGSPGLWG
jgi:hypothetical protein